MKSLTVIDELNVASPCSADWNDMTGGDLVRHCGSCEKNVYNLSAMTREDAIGLVNELEEDGFCGRFYRRADGTMLTVDCPVGLREKMRRASRRAFAAGLYMVTMLALGALSFFVGRTMADDQSCDTATDFTAKVTDKLIGPPVQELIEEEPTMGDMDVIEPPPPAPPRDMGRMVKGGMRPPPNPAMGGITERQ